MQNVQPARNEIEYMNKPAAAKQVGVSPRTLDYWIQQCWIAALPYETASGVSFLVPKREIALMKQLRERTDEWARELTDTAKEYKLLPVKTGAVSILAMRSDWSRG